MPPRSASRFASKGAFDALASSDADDSIAATVDSDEEEEAEDALQAAAATNDGPAKLTRTQQKKLAKEAREAKKASKAAATNGTATPKSSAVPAAVATNGHNGADDDAQDEDDDAGSIVELSDETAPTTAVGRDPVIAVSPPPAEAPVTRAAARAAQTNGSSLAPSSSSSAAPAAATSTRSVPSTSQKLENPGAPLDSLTVPSSKPAAAIEKVTSAIASATNTEDEKKAEERAAYWKKIRDRTFFSLLMIGGFLVLLCLGHPYIIILVLVIQVLVYREVTALFEIPGRPSITGGAPRRSPLSRHNSSVGVPKIRKSAPGAIDESAQVSEDEEDFREEVRKELVWSKTLSWYFFTAANFFLYGESLIYYFKHIVFVDSYFLPFAKHHRFLSFLLYVIGFVAFVSGLRRENLKHQFGLFGWVHMSLLLIVFSSHFLVNNILEGLIWFFVPASLVICNDVFAYVCGMIWGRTPLISLSPKKTVEGFVGALIITEVFAIGWATFFQRFNYLICPAVSLGMNAFQDIQCQPNSVFLWQSIPLPASISTFLSTNLHLHLTAIPYTTFQLHSLVLAAFASLVAPFGGFFASGFKRAFNIKDFGDSIPGHGGLTDRFDCQFLMGIFAYVYYSSLIREHRVTVGSVLQTVVTQLTKEEQVEAYREIGRFLVGRGVTL